MRLLEFEYDRVSGLLQKLPIALRLQDLQFIAPFIEQEDQPHRLRRGYDLWETDSFRAGAAQVAIPNRQVMFRNKEQVRTLVYQAAYRDRAGKLYHNETFLHIAERFLANRPLAVKYYNAFPAQLRWQDALTAPHYFLNAVDYMVSATVLTIMNNGNIVQNYSFFSISDSGN